LERVNDYLELRNLLKYLKTRYTYRYLAEKLDTTTYSVYRYITGKRGMPRSRERLQKMLKVCRRLARRMHRQTKFVLDDFELISHSFICPVCGTGIELLLLPGDAILRVSVFRNASSQAQEN